MKNLIKFVHRILEKKCVEIVYKIHKTDYIPPWWFKPISKIEFKLRYMYKNNNRHPWMQ